MGLKKEEAKDKRVAWYSAKVNAWISTKMESDKSFFALSSSAIGLLVVFILAKPVLNIYEYLLFLFSLISFCITVIITNIIFEKNAKYIELLDDETEGVNLKRYDCIKKYSFIIGDLLIVILAAILGSKRIIMGS